MATPKKRRCQGDHPDPAEHESSCKLCWNAVHVRRWQRAYGLPQTGEYEAPPSRPGHSNPTPVKKATAKLSIPCVNQGVLVQHARCPCPGKNVYRCDLKGIDVRPLESCGPGKCESYAADSPFDIDVARGV
jgi:hypothetical protein